MRKDIFKLRDFCQLIAFLRTVSVSLIFSHCLLVSLLTDSILLHYLLNSFSMYFSVLFTSFTTNSFFFFLCLSLYFPSFPSFLSPPPLTTTIPFHFSLLLFHTQILSLSLSTHILSPSQHKNLWSRGRMPLIFGIKLSWAGTIKLFMSIIQLICD